VKPAGPDIGIADLVDDALAVLYESGVGICGNESVADGRSYESTRPIDTSSLAVTWSRSHVHHAEAQSASALTNLTLLRTTCGKPP